MAPNCPWRGVTQGLCAVGDDNFRYRTVVSRVEDLMKPLLDTGLRRAWARLVVLFAAVATVLSFGLGSASASPEEIGSTSEDGVSIGWGLPQTLQQRSATTEDPPVTFESKVLADGAQTLIHINRPDAPHAFRFPVQVPEGGKLEDMGDGTVSLNVDRMPHGGFTVPWAKDANGQSVPTYLQVEGSDLVQIVEFDENTAFPIVADPRFDWGIVSGHAYFNKEETRMMAAAGAGGIAALPWIALIPPPFQEVVLANVVNISAWAISAQATGKCLALKFGATGTWWPPAIGVNGEHHTGSDCY